MSMFGLMVRDIRVILPDQFMEPVVDRIQACPVGNAQGERSVPDRLCGCSCHYPVFLSDSLRTGYEAKGMVVTKKNPSW